VKGQDLPIHVEGQVTPRRCSARVFGAPELGFGQLRVRNRSDPPVELMLAGGLERSVCVSWWVTAGVSLVADHAAELEAGEADSG
jgi:hypothetical protein